MSCAARARSAVGYGAAVGVGVAVGAAAVAAPVYVAPGYARVSMLRADSTYAASGAVRALILSD